jgi:prepilin-type processing-associated H-X9-DG protein
MKTKRSFTQKDIIIALVCLIFLVINAGAINSSGRRHAKRAVCLTNLRQLMLAWTNYAGDNDGFIVNGAPLGFTACQANPGTGEHAGEIPWVGRDWGYIYYPGQPTLEECQVSAIRDGALWPYCQDLKLYYCPSGYQGSIRSYGIVDGMNGMSRSGEGTIAGVHWIKNIAQIINPAERLVFIDEGWVTPDSYAVHFNRELWWEDPSVRHGGGTSVSFADGHSQWHRWKGKWTVAYGLATIGFHPQSNYPPGTMLPDGTIVPATIDDYHDLYWIQTGCWGELGYTPSY